ncbi:MAG: 30S ribosomal protein S1 [Gammaproteobacteria bacterium]
MIQTNQVQESFAELFQESLKQADLRPGAVIKAKVVRIDKDNVTVNAGLKSEGIISVSEFLNAQGQLETKEGDEVDVVVEILEDGFGETRLSREKAKRAEAWLDLEKAHKSNETITGIITERVKGGFTVELSAVRAFLPGSLVDVRPVRDASHLEGRDLEFKIIKMDRKRNNIVVSRRAVIEEESKTERLSLLENLEEGQVVKGVVKNITDYGAFIDLGGVDGLLHITDMSWKRVKHPGELLNVGDETEVVVLKIDRDKKRVSLGMKQLGSDPWFDIAGRYPIGSRLTGRVTNLTDYGCFVEIEHGIEGLVHMSEMDWTNKNIHPSKVVQLGNEVEVMVLDVDEERHRISLGIKQCLPNPWREFETKHQKGEKIVGKIRSITDFGIFVGLEGGIDGLVHLSDISWAMPGEEVVRNYKKGDDIEAVILGIDAERERISLGIKQLGGDPFSSFVEAHPKGSTVKGTVTGLEAKLVIVDLEGVIGHLRMTDVEGEIKEGDTIEAKVLGLDRKSRVINLTQKSVRDEEGSRRGGEQAEETKSTTLGDLLKEQMKKQA